LIVRRKTPFIWLPDQEIDHAAGFATLRSKSVRRDDEGVNRWILARGSFEGRIGPGGEISITVDGRYRLWLNGGPVGRGPVRASPHFQRFDRYAIVPRDGANLLALLVHVPGVDLAWYEMMRGAWQPVFGDGGLHVEVRVGGANVPIDWRIKETDAWRRDTVRGGWGQDFIEDFDARRLDPNWIQPEFRDDDWPAGRQMISMGGDAETARGFGRVEPFPSLLESPIPPPQEARILPSRLLWIRSSSQSSALPIETRLYVERPAQDAASLVENSVALLEDSEAAARVRTDEGRATVIMLAFDPYHAGRPYIEFEAKGGECVELAVGEAIPGEFGIGESGAGLELDGHLAVAQTMRVIARPGVQCFEKFNWAAVRAMQIVVRDAPDGIAIRRVGSLATHYPARCEGAFECSDPLLTQLWAVGRHTVLQCMHDSWVDCPGREARQWVGDAVVQFDIAALAFGPSIYPLQQQFLRQAAESQRADGLVRMFAPGDIGPDGLVIPDFSLLWVLAAERYFMHSGDETTIEAVMPSIERSLAWFERHLDANHLLCDVPHWHFIEWANVGRTGEAAAINALHVGALKAAAALARIVERPRLSEGWSRLAEASAASLNARHWDEERGLYVDSVDGATGARGLRASQHANALILSFGMAPPDRRAAMIAAITDSARLKLTAAPPIVPTGAEFDERIDIVRANSFSSHFVYAGIADAGAFDWVLRDIRANYGPMIAAGTTTLWESFTPNASLCHGFSATPVYQLSRHCLGVIPEAPGFARFSVRPEPGDLEWARGAVPTPHGPIEIEWRAEAQQLKLTVRHPTECAMSVPERENWHLVSQEAVEGGATLCFVRT
jgi:hypothetical protein